MWRFVLLCLGLTLAGCTGFGSSRDVPALARPPPAVAVDGTTMRRLMGQDAFDQPLLPQPGNIWADVLPATQPGPPGATPPSFRSGNLPIAAVASSVRLVRPAVLVIAAEAATAAGPSMSALPPTAALAPAPARPLPANPPPTVAVTPATGLPAAGPEMAKAAPRPASRPVVQLAAAGSEQRAQAEWRRLREQARTLTEGHLPAVSEADVNGQHVWRLRAAGFADVAEASAFCTGMHAVKANCWVIPPSATP